MIEKDLEGRYYSKEFLKKETNNVTSFCMVEFDNLHYLDDECFGEKVDKYLIMKKIRNYTFNKQIPVMRCENELYNTIKLVIATYSIYEDKIPNAAYLLGWAMKIIDTGLLNNCPKFTHIDKDFKCIKEFYSYIQEVKDSYYYGTNSSTRAIPPVYTGRTFKKDIKVNELKDLYTEIVREDTYEYIASKGIEFNLERMFSNYEFYRDMIEYKLQDIDDFSWNLDSELIKFYDIDSDTDGVIVECIDCRTLPLEMALHVSFMYCCTVTVSYLNRHNEVTIFEVDCGVPKVINNKRKKAKFISRLLLNIDKSNFNKEALSKFILKEFGTKHKFDVFGTDVNKVLKSKFDINLEPGKKKKLYKKRLYKKIDNN